MDNPLRNIELFLVYLDPSKCPRQFKLSVLKNGTMKDLCDTLAKVANVDASANSLVVTDVYNHRFHKIYTGDDTVSKILDRDDIYIYEIPKESREQRILPIYLRNQRRNNVSADLFGQPFLLSVPKEKFSFKFLYDTIIQSISRCVPCPPTHKLFDIKIVNTYGNATIQHLDSNDSSIRLEDKHYLALDWEPISKSSYYNEKLVDDFSQDHSFLCRAASKLDCLLCSEYCKAKERDKIIREDLKETTEDVKKNIITKIDKLNGDLEKLNAPNMVEIKKLDQRFSKTIQSLKISKSKKMKMTINAKEKEIKSIEEKYSVLLENIETEGEKEEGYARKAYQDEKRAIESNTNMVRKEISGVINNLTDTLHKLEKPNEPDINVKKELECPVCLDEMKPPMRIFQCASGHLICETCRGRLQTDKCPTCEVASIMGRATAVEQLARALYRHND